MSLRRPSSMLALAAAVVTALSLITAARGAPELPKDQTLYVSLGTEVNSLDPYAFTDTRTHTLILQLFDPVLDHSPMNGDVIPRLAASVRPLNPTLWELTLQSNMKFTDGEPVDANAVKFSLARMLDPQHKYPLTSQFAWIKTVTVVDPHTVRIATATPYPLVRQMLSVASIVPPKYVQTVGDSAFARNPWAMGPTNWSPGSPGSSSS